MNHTQNPLPKILQIVFYSLLGSTMIYTGYVYLTFGTDDIQNIRFSDLIEAWPIFFLGISCALLWVSVFLCISRPQLAARLALVAVAPGWLYYLFVVCVSSILIFINLKGFVAYFIPLVLLFITTILSLGVARSGRPPQAPSGN